MELQPQRDGQAVLAQLRVADVRSVDVLERDPLVLAVKGDHGAELVLRVLHPHAVVRHARLVPPDVQQCPLFGRVVERPVVHGVFVAGIWRID